MASKRYIPGSVSVLGEHGETLRVEAASSNPGNFYLRRHGEKNAEMLSRFLHKPLTLTDHVEVFGMREQDIVLIQKDTELMKDIVYLVDECKFTIRSTTDSCVFLGPRPDKLNFKADAEFVICAKRIAAKLEVMPTFEGPKGAVTHSLDNVRNYLTGWLMLSGIASVAYFWFGMQLGWADGVRVLSFADLVIPGLLATVISVLLLVGIPFFFLRKSPFTPVVLSEWKISFWLFSFATGFATVILVNEITPTQQETIRYSGELYLKAGRKSVHYYLRAVDVAPSVFGESASTVRLTSSQYDKLKGFPAKHDGVFDVTFDRGVLNAPYVAEVKRVSVTVSGHNAT